MWKLQENILEADDRKVLSDFVLKTERFTQHEQVRSFEQAWSKWQGCKYSVFVNSGSSADLLMLNVVKEHFKIPDGSEVLVPAVTWSTNVTSVMQAGLLPVFVDINLDDLSFDYEELEKNIDKNTRIILVTHLLGIPANIDLLENMADKHGLILLEDCCEAHGARFQGQKVGNFGTMSTFSFYWGHHITTIEGGMICTDNEELYDSLLLKRSHGLARELPIERHEEYQKAFPDVNFNFLFITDGFNVRNTELHAIVGLSQLKRLDGYIEKRNTNFYDFIDIIENMKDQLYMISSYGISSFCLPFIFRDRDIKLWLQKKLEDVRIETRPIVGGNLLRQPCFRRYGVPAYYKHADIVHFNGFYIGNNQFVNEERLNLLKDILYD